MKVKIVLIIGLLIGLISIASENGVALDQNKDRTGTPDGSSTCGQCHNSGSFNPFMDLIITDQNGDPVTGYIEGDTLNLRYSLTSFAGPPPSAFGFQSTVLDSLLADAGQFVNPGLNVQVEEVNTVDIPSRHIVEHSNPAPVGIFNVGWVAPANIGPVTFYYSGNVADGNGGSGGDNSQNGTFTLDHILPDGLEESELGGLILRPSQEGVWIESAEYTHLDNVVTYSLNGQVSMRLQRLALPHQIILPQGLSILTINHEERRLNRKIFHSE